MESKKITKCFSSEWRTTSVTSGTAQAYSSAMKMVAVFGSSVNDGRAYTVSSILEPSVYKR